MTDEQPRDEEGNYAEKPDESNDGDGATNSVDDRWWLTNDVVTLGLNAAFIGLIYLDALDHAALGDIPAMAWMGLLALVLGANFWAFGPAARDAWQAVQKNGGGGK
ncbi:hypothetical protein [Halocalculus aciditolerans]|uniref:hypothetical protein n=1 Tax=Halocalculus aciditolerans TaxID=1383812 RepID=UPI00166EA852|nr:hypothetical protein [Halocalculus aciditolerans]